MMCEDRLFHTVSAEEDGRPLGSLLRKTFGLSGSMIKVLKYNGGLLRNDLPIRTVDPVRTGDRIIVLLNVTDKRPEAKAEALPLEILYEDRALIAVNKPAGMVVHTTCLHRSGTLSNALAWHMEKNGIPGSIHPVSRLDRDTSGIVLFARNGYVQEELKKQGQNGLFRKIYCGLCFPAPAEPQGIITLPIKRAPNTIMLRTTADDGAPAMTEYRTLQTMESGVALVEFLLHTGRTHQIRVHTSAMGFPLVGDRLYGGRLFPEIPSDGQALWAGEISFCHPVTRLPIRIKAPRPAWWPITM